MPYKMKKIKLIEIVRNLCYYNEKAKILQISSDSYIMRHQNEHFPSFSH